MTATSDVWKQKLTFVVLLILMVGLVLHMCDVLVDICNYHCRPHRKTLSLSLSFSRYCFIDKGNLQLCGYQSFYYLQERLQFSVKSRACRIIKIHSTFPPSSKFHLLMLYFRKWKYPPFCIASFECNGEDIWNHFQTSCFRPLVLPERLISSFSESRVDKIIVILKLDHWV